MSETFDEFLSKNHKLFYVNLGVEEYWNNKKGFGFSQLRLRNIGEIATLLSKSTDYVIVDRLPSNEYCDYMKGIGFEIPTYIKRIDDSGNEISLKGVLGYLSRAKKVVFVPYVYDGKAVVAYEESKKNGNVELINNQGINAQYENNKVIMFDYLSKKGIKYPNTRVINDRDEVLYQYKHFKDVGIDKVVYKRCYGAGGNGNIIIDRAKAIDGIKRHFCLDNQKALMEEYCQDAEGYNAQIYISSNGNIDLFMLSRQCVKMMKYVGSEFCSNIWNYAEKEAIKEEVLKVAELLSQKGIRGIVGIDGFRSNNMIYPAIDVNVRFTMTTYLYKFVQKCDGYIKTTIMDIRLGKPLYYEMVLDKLKNAGILFEADNTEGVIPYIEGALPCDETRINGTYVGRIYAIIVSDTKEKCDKIHELMEAVIKGD